MQTNGALRARRRRIEGERTALAASIFNLGKVILASESPRRLQLLRLAGCDCAVFAHPIDETRQSGEAPHAYCLRMAIEKNRAARQALARRGPKGAPADLDASLPLVSGDTAVVADNDVLGKPKDRNDAKRMLAKLAGRSHLVLSAVCVSTAHFEKADLSVSEVSFDALSDETIDAYLDLGEYAGKAGAYAIQGAAQVFVKKISGSHSGVMGLPLREAAALIAEAARSRAENGGPSVP